MRSFTISIDPTTTDVAAALHEGLEATRSIFVPRKTWAQLLQSIGVAVRPYLQQEVVDMTVAAEALVVEGVPEKGSPHPQRAEWNGEGDHHVWFTTPGGVHISLKNEGGVLEVLVDFNRDSSYLATVMLAGFFKRIPAVASLLAQAANEAAQAA